MNIGRTRFINQMKLCKLRYQALQRAAPLTGPGSVPRWIRETEDMIRIMDQRGDRVLGDKSLRIATISHPITSRVLD
jgi:hypothetical protein